MLRLIPIDILEMIKVNFKELFCEKPGEEYPQKREYKGKRIFLVDKFLVSNQDKLIISIEKTNSIYTQGVGIDIYGSCKFLNERYSKGKHVFMRFWEDAEGYNPKSIDLQVFTKESYVFVYNIWEMDICEESRITEGKTTLKQLEKGKKVPCYVGSTEWLKGQGNGAAMYAESIPNGKRYFCNDGNEDDDFDDIIFTVQRRT
jgi:hypothetical protein